MKKVLYLLALPILVFTACSPKYTASFQSNDRSFVTTPPPPPPPSLVHQTELVSTDAKSSQVNAANQLMAQAQEPLMLASADNSIPIDNVTANAIQTLVEARNNKANPNSLSQTHSKSKIREAKKVLKSEIKKAKKEAKATGSEPTTGKSQLIALLLVIFAGWISAHRFYLGYIGSAVLQILTLGGCGIWYLIDAIRIITGDLKPKNFSDYAEKI